MQHTVTTTQGFAGTTVAVFESRMADVMAKSVSRYGGMPLSAPALQEVPLGRQPEAAAFGERLLAGEVDVLVCMTGVGTRLLLETLESRDPWDRIAAALSKVTVVARGPKPLRVLKDRGIAIALTVPEPNTWQEILQALEQSERSVPLEGRLVAVQEYGVSNERLLEALKRRGARVMRVPVYRWALPDDTAPVLRAIDAVIGGGVQFALFTNAAQVRHLLRLAGECGREGAFREALRRVVIASIGPTTSETLQDCGLRADFEPTHSKMGLFVSELAAQAVALLEARARPLHRFTGAVPSAGRPMEARRDSPFLAACRGEAAGVTPVWLMRQAGRYLPEYRRVRSAVSFLELCKTKELAAEVTISAVESLGVDAAIIFSDLLLIVEPLGLELEYTAEEGPVIGGGASVTAAGVDRLREIEPGESLGFVFDAVRLARAGLDARVPLIGFAGAPFTLASYIIEGGTSRSFIQTKRFMYRDPGAWRALMEKLSRGIAKYLIGQIEAGADAVQLFDSWVGCLSPADYREFVLPHTRAVIRALPQGTPVIQFGTQTATLLAAMREAGGDVIGVDHRIELDEAWRQIGSGVGIQGNLDPVALFAEPETIRARVRRLLSRAGGLPGHIANLGHGVLPGTPPDHARIFVDAVHEFSRR
ncbi:MAG TPA: uroporphyrinogen decarboxylase [bacterium]